MDHLLVDTATIALIRNPRQFDVIVTENTFGDILTDEVAVLAGVARRATVCLAQWRSADAPRFARAALRLL